MLASLLTLIALLSLAYGLMKLLKAKPQYTRYAAVGITIPVGAFMALFRVYSIPVSSMEPTVKLGDYLIANKMAYSAREPWFDIPLGTFATPQRGDVIVFEYPSSRAIIYLKRVIGVPGDKIVYTSAKQLYINDELITDTPGAEVRSGLMQGELFEERIGEVTFSIQQMEGLNRQWPTKSWVVPAGHYFVMGDNRDNSNDSRYWDDEAIAPELRAMVPEENILGKAVFLPLKLSRVH